MQCTAEVRRVVGLVGVQLGRALPRTARSSSWANDRWDDIDEREQLGGIVRVGGGETDGQRDAIPIDGEVVLGARLAAVCGVRTGLLAPLLARTVRLSTLARLQSMAASSPS